MDIIDKKTGDGSRYVEFESLQFVGGSDRLADVEGEVVGLVQLALRVASGEVDVDRNGHFGEVDASPYQFFADVSQNHFYCLSNLHCLLFIHVGKAALRMRQIGTNLSLFRFEFIVDH